VSERRLVRVTGALALAGAAVAGYLTFSHYADSKIACPTGGCETVQSSAYAVIGPVPVALLGLLAYLAILAGLLLPRETRWAIVFATALTGAIFSAYLFAIQAFELKAFCTWCLVSDVLVSVVAAVSAAALWAGRADSAKHGHVWQGDTER
jgi:uncharacterized membrane protein